MNLYLFRDGFGKFLGLGVGSTHAEARNNIIASKSPSDVAAIHAETLADVFLGADELETQKDLVPAGRRTRIEEARAEKERLDDESRGGGGGGRQ